MTTCETCGQEWPESYCPQCGHSIGQAGRAAGPPQLPPPLPGAKESIPVHRTDQPGKKSPPRWAVIGFIVLAGLMGGGAFVYHLYDQFSFPPGYRNQPTAGWGVRKGEKEFGNANDQIDSFQGKTAFGNSPEAVEVARHFSSALKAGRARMFTPGFNLEILDHTKGEFMTYCELHSGECAIIVHVPGLRKFEKSVLEKVDARKSLAQLAWMTAQRVLGESGAGKPKMELAVGLRGISQYGPIMLGFYDEKAQTPEDGLVKYLDDGAQTHFLWTFFGPEGERGGTR
jgi:hypothetical protein